MTRILVFNHSPNILRLFSEVLTKKGFEVVTRLEEVTTLEQVEGIDPDVIILGYLRGTPDDGGDILIDLQAHPTLGKIPIIVASTSVLQIQQHTPIGTMHGVSFLEKPFDMNALVHAVQDAVALAGDGAALPYPPSNPLPDGSEPDGVRTISRDALNSDAPIQS